jgi:hypothetical protein
MLSCDYCLYFTNSKSGAENQGGVKDGNGKNNLSASLSRKAASLPEISRFGAFGKEGTKGEREAG